MAINFCLGGTIQNVGLGMVEITRMPGIFPTRSRPSPEHDSLMLCALSRATLGTQLRFTLIKGQHLAPLDSLGLV